MEPLTKEQISLLKAMVSRDINISCENIALFWDDEWEECPVCGAQIDERGDIKHTAPQ